jgi:hypothetical protein
MHTDTSRMLSAMSFAAPRARFSPVFARLARPASVAVLATSAVATKRSGAASSTYPATQPQNPLLAQFKKGYSSSVWSPKFRRRPVTLLLLHI